MQKTIESLQNYTMVLDGGPHSISWRWPWGLILVTRHQYHVLELQSAKTKIKTWYWLMTRLLQFY